MGQGVILKRSVSGACRAARAGAKCTGFLARLLMHLTIALAVSGCAQSPPAGSALRHAAYVSAATDPTFL